MSQLLDEHERAVELIPCLIRPSLSALRIDVSDVLELVATVASHGDVAYARSRPLTVASTSFGGGATSKPTRTAGFHPSLVPEARDRMDHVRTSEWIAARAREPAAARQARPGRIALYGWSTESSRGCEGRS